MILVTGANGQLGNEIRRLAGNYPDLTFLYTDVAELDITNENAIDHCLKTNKVKAIINCAAYTAVDKAEQEPEMANLINAAAAGNLARAAATNHCLLVHISTDYVFSGTGHRPYNEEDPTGPVSLYAKSKHAGEQEVIQFAEQALIIRTSWLYSEFGHNFVKTIMKYGRERGMLRVVYDQIGTPTYAADLAKCILDILANHPAPAGTSIFHYSDEGVCSWYDFALAIIELSGLECKIFPIETHEYPLPAVRPWYSVFNKSRIKKTYNIEIPYWRDSLKVCINRIINN